MSREIKFRVFNKETGKMKDWDFIRKYSNLSKLIAIKHNEIMQFSGSKDRNDVEIYEGDIVEIWGTKQVIEWKNYDNYQGFDIETDDNDIVVLGNIFENPELL